MDFEGSPARQSLKISRELRLVTPMDLLVRTPAQFRERLRIEDPFMREIVQRGRVMYETEQAIEDCRTVRRAIRQSFDLPT